MSHAEVSRHMKVSKLPKGLKWSDSRVITKHEPNLVNPTISFYPYGNDLYIRGLYLIYTKDSGDKVHQRKPIVVLNNYKNYTAIQVNIDYEFYRDPLISYIICEVWNELGLRQGYTEPILKDFELKSKKSLEDMGC